MRSRTKTTQVNGTNLAAATNYYPDSTGIDMDGISDISVGMVCSGGVTITFEASHDGTNFTDITKAGYSLNTNATGAASFIDKTDIVDFDGIDTKRFRVKSVTADASNAVLLTTRIEGETLVISG